MHTTGPTPDEHDWDPRGPLTQGPDALPQLQASLGVLLGLDQPVTNGEPIVVRQDHCRALTVQAVGDPIAVMNRRSDETADARSPWLTTPPASDVAGALLVAPPA